MSAPRQAKSTEPSARPTKKRLSAYRPPTFGSGWLGLGLQPFDHPFVIFFQNDQTRTRGIGTTMSISGRTGLVRFGIWTVTSLAAGRRPGIPIDL